MAAVTGRSSGLLLDVLNLSRTQAIPLFYGSFLSLLSEELLLPLRICAVFILCDFCLPPAVVGPMSRSCKVPLTT